MSKAPDPKKDPQGFADYVKNNPDQKKGGDNNQRYINESRASVASKATGKRPTK